MKLRLLHLSDLHLGCKNFYLGEAALARSDEFKAAFRDAVEYALNDYNQIQGVIIAGDLFEYHRPEAELWSFAKGLVSRLLAKNMLVAIVPGQHDSFAYKNSVWRTERLPGVELFLNTAPEAPRVREIKGTRVFLYGVTYVPGQTPEPLPAFERSKEGGVHIGIVHGFAPANPEYVKRPHQLEIDLERLASSGLDYVALGGYHAFSEHQIGSTTLVYPGALEGRSFETGETGEKGPVVVEFDAGGDRTAGRGLVHIERLIANKKTISRVQLDLRKEKITDAAGLRCAVEALADRNSIVQLVLTGTAEFVADLEEIRRETAGRFHYFDLIDQSRIVDSALIRKIESENTIRGYFVRKLRGRVEAIKAKILKSGQTPESARELRVAEAAMKLGVEQFVEEEASADSIYNLIPDSEDMVASPETKSANGIGRIENRLKAILESAAEKSAAEAASRNHADADRSNGSNGVVHEENR